MDFGLNLILTFTDKATNGLRAATGALSTVTAQVKSTSSMLTKLGNSFSALSSLGLGMTAAITAPIAGFMGKIVQYGIQRASFVEDTKLAFNTLMGSAAEASTYLNDLMTFAKTTPFTYESITSAAQNMIAVGIDSTKILGDKMNNFKGGLLQALGDVAGATGKGAAGFSYYADVMGKMAAEGKVSAIRLQQLATQGLNLSNILGKSEEELKKMKAGDLIDEFVNTANEKFGGMMSELKNTWTGAKDSFTSALKTAGLELMGFYVDAEGISRYTFLENMTTGLNHLSNAVKAVSPILQPVMDFINEVMNKGAVIIDNTAQLLTEMKEGERVLTPLGKIMSNILKVLVLAGPALIVIGKVGGTIAPMISTIGSMLGSLPLFLPALLGMFAILWSTWHNDLFGIQSFIFDFVSGTIDAFNTARDAVQLDAKDMMKVFNDLDSSTFFGRLTKSLMKIMVFLDGLADAWDDGTMSEENFQRASEIGVINLISRVLDLKYRVEEFFKGFKKGFKKAIGEIAEFGNKIREMLPDDLGKKLEDFLTLITKDDLNVWESFGEKVGELAPKLIIGAIAFKALFKAVSLIQGVGSILSGVSSTIGTVAGNIGSTVGGIGTSIIESLSAGGAGANTAGAFTNLLSVMFEGVNIAAVGAVAAGVLASIFAFAFDKPEEFKGMLTDFITGITERFEEFKENVKTFFDPIIDSFNNIKEAASNLWDALQQGWNDLLQNPTVQAIIGVLSAIGETIMGTVLPVLESAIDFIISLVEGAVNIISETIGGVIDIVSGVFNIIAGLITGDGTLIQTGIDQILQGVINIITSVIGTIVNLIRTVLEAIGGFIVGAVQGIASVVGSGLNLVFTIIGNVLNSIIDKVSSFVDSVLRFFGFDGLADKVNSVFTGIKNNISNIINSIKSIITRGVEAFKKAFNFTWKLPDIKVPHFKVSGGEPPFGIMGKGSLPKLDVSWYKQGGVFEKPSVIGVGEAGTEAVMPLESNLEWIDVLAKRLVSAIHVTGDTTNIQNIQNLASDGNVSAVTPRIAGVTTTNNNTSTTDARSIDNRVVFNEGAIQISMNGSSDVDVTTLAKQIMSEIARQKQIQDSVNYGINYAAGGI